MARSIGQTAPVTDDLAPGLYATVVTKALLAQLSAVDERLIRREGLRAADAADRIAQVLARQIMRALEALPDGDRVSVGVEVAQLLMDALHARLPRATGVIDPIAAPGELLTAIGEPPVGRLGPSPRSAADSAARHDPADQCDR
jgi:hypothetical protein